MAQNLTPLEFDKVDITGGFWFDKQNINKKATLEAVHNRFKQTGRFDAFACRWDGIPEHKPHVYWDSDIAKWIEGASYIVAKKSDESIIARIEEVIDNIEKKRDENGYFNSYYLAVEPEKKFTVRINHELYCLGHLIEAAIAYKHATGKDRFLELMCDYTDYVYNVFLIENSAAFMTPGHQEIEIALVALYKETGNEKYLQLAKFFMNERGNNDKETDNAISLKKNLMYEQSHIPVSQQYEAVGHCVRALYMYSAMADIAEILDERETFAQLEALFYDIVNKKMYITGGVGSTSIGEAFTLPYDLPNETAYNETCASIAMAMFAFRMGNRFKNGIYADIVELELYNGILSGVSDDGTAFFYENPLSVTPKLRERHTSTRVPSPHLAPVQRKAVFDCSCCPPNILRTLAHLGQWIYGTDENETLFVHQYATSEAKLANGFVKTVTNYPYDGHVAIQADGIEKIAVRIPGWCDKFSINVPYELKNGYAYINYEKEIEIDFDMPVVFIEANVRVLDNTDKIAVKRGPVVYCAEQIDNGAYLDNLRIDVSGEFKVDKDSILLKGKRRMDFNNLYRMYQACDYEDAEIKLVPYRTFANRGVSEMRVWLTPSKGEKI